MDHFCDSLEVEKRSTGDEERNEGEAVDAEVDVKGDADGIVVVRLRDRVPDQRFAHGVVRVVVPRPVLLAESRGVV